MGSLPVDDAARGNPSLVGLQVHLRRTSSLCQRNRVAGVTMNAPQRSRANTLLIAGRNSLSRRQLGALDLATEHGEFVAQDQHLSFGVRGDPKIPLNLRMGRTIA